MKRRHLFAAGALLVATVVLYLSVAPPRSATNARVADFLDSYTAVLERGDSTEVYEFWHTSSRDREGFWWMHSHIGGMVSLRRFSGLLEHFALEIDRIEHIDDYHVVHVNWVQKDSHEETSTATRRYPMRFYILEQDGELALINPVDLLTRDWLTHESDHFVFHYPRAIEVGASRDARRRLNAQAKAFCAAVDVAIPDKMDYYLCRTQEECGALYTQRPSNGYAALRKRAIVSVTFDNTHEAIHLISHLSGLNPANAGLSEGLAVAFGGNTRTTPEYALMRTASLVESSAYVPLTELFNDVGRFMRENYVTYHEAGAFVRFLHDEFGADPLKQFLTAAASNDSVQVVCEAVYDLGLAELESRWKPYLKRHRGSRIATSVPNAARPVFALEDPAGDDAGDGDYEYPNDRFEAGVFDLRRFEVLEDDDYVYFRIQFERLGQPVSYSPEGELFVPGVVVALATSAGNQQQQRLCDGVRFAGQRGYDLKVNVGVHASIVNHQGRVTWCSPNRIDRSDRAQLELGLPRNLVGDPSPGWEYFVGVGLMSDRTMDFLYAGPMPVQREARIFIGGGNLEFGNPPFIDILLPAGQDQAAVLENYDVGQPAVVPMMGGR
jgi:hypothetical protein